MNESVLRKYIRNMLLEAGTYPPRNIDVLLKHAAIALDDSLFFTDLEDLMVENLLRILKFTSQGSGDPGLDLVGNAEKVLQAKIMTMAVSRYSDPYDIRGLKNLSPLKADGWMTSGETKEAVVDLIYKRPEYAEVLEAYREYATFGEELLEFQDDPGVAKRELAPVYEMVDILSRDKGNFMQAVELWSMLR